MGNPDPSRYVPLFRGGDDFDLAMVRYFDSEQGEGISKSLRKKRLTVKDTDQTYRLINHWSSLGLIADERESDGKWRKLSLIDVVWVHVLVALREFGFPLEKLKAAQGTLFEKNGDVCELFEFAIVEAMRLQPQYVIAFADGRAAALSAHALQINHRELLLENYVCINLNDILTRVFRHVDYTPTSHPVQLHDEELAVLIQIRSGNYDSISVRMKDGRVEMIESTETIDVQKKIVELLRDADFQLIEVKARDGNIASIRRTVKKKPASKATGRPRASHSTEPLRPSDAPTSDAVPSHAHD